MEMIRINLLPKEYRKKTGRFSFGKTGYYAGGAVAGVIIMIVAVSFFQMYQIRELDDKINIARFRTSQLEKDIRVVDALIDVKEKIVKRMEAVDRLDQHRTVWVRIMEDLSDRLPEFLWLGKLSEETAKAPADTTASGATAGAEAITRPVKIEGFAFTLNSLANFMIKLMRSNFFTDVEMASVEEIQFQEQKVYNYSVTATLHYLSDEEVKKLLEQESGPQLLAGF